MGQTTSTPSPPKPPTHAQSSPAACPVDHNSRSAWLQRASEVQPSSKESAENCPVDPKARQAWLEQAGPSQSANSSPHPNSKGAPTSSGTPLSPFPGSRISTTLATSREISSIPRATTAPPDPVSPTSAASHPTASHASPLPANSERESGASSSGHWIYPSESQFYAALQRKSLHTAPQDMRNVVPLHNAVNERVWAEILTWEAPYRTPACPPKLATFSGNSAKWTPRAYWYVYWKGAKPPFDRHDWIVERCCGEEKGGGERTKVEYVIDFYAGKADEGRNGKPVNFYLDVRPKLNSWAGLTTRVGRFWREGKV